MSMHSERSLKKIGVLAKIVIALVVLFCSVVIFFSLTSILCIEPPLPSPGYASLEEEYNDTILLYVNEGKVELPQGTSIFISDVSVTLTHIDSKTYSTCRVASNGLPIFSWHLSSSASNYVLAFVITLFSSILIWFFITFIACLFLRKKCSSHDSRL